MTREFSIVRELSRREVESHEKRFIGITMTKPAFVEQDDNGLTEFVVDVRVGIENGWAAVKNCIVAQWAIGVVTDINVPVLCERSEAGRVTVIARSEVNLPDIVLDSYQYEELGFAFMRNLEIEDDGSLIDGFGYEMAPSGSVVPEDGETDNEAQNRSKAFGEGGKNRNFNFSNNLIEWGSDDFDYGATVFGQRTMDWEG
jgi:hypothetical protein